MCPNAQAEIFPFAARFRTHDLRNNKFIVNTFAS